MKNDGEFEQIEPLTERERDVLELLVLGKTDQQIADALVLSINTVKWYNRQIYGKLGVKNRAEAAERARDLGLVKGDKPWERPTYLLPHPATSLLGRERELEELEGLLLDGRTRIVSIIGPGGMGKTRLAIELAHKLDGRFADGAAFVPLAPLQSEESIIPAIAQSLRFTFQGGGLEEKTQLLNFLREKKLLIVLDNYEHLIDSAPLLTEIAETAPMLKMVVTSREKLKLQIEQLYPLQSFPLMDWETVEQAEQDPAVRLFLEYGRRVRPSFELLSEDLRALHQILHLVGGMPLAIILASAWLELLTPGEIAAEIKKNIDFLEAGYQDLPGRQRSMRVVFDTSWKQLNEKEQKVFSALSVFRGGFTLDAAREVVGATPGILLGLVSRSLLNRDENGRFEIHELLRQFGAEKLTAWPEFENNTLNQHSSYFCAYLHQHSQNWHSHLQLKTVAAVRTDLENSRKSLQWALIHRRWPWIYQAMDSWGWYYDWQGRHRDGKNLFQEIIIAAEAQDAGVLSASADCLRVWIRALAWLIMFAHDFQFRTIKQEQALTLLERPKLADLDTRYDKAFVRIIYAKFLVIIDPTKAQLLYEQLLNEFQKLDNQWGISECLLGLSRIDFHTGRFGSALEKLTTVKQIYQEQGNHWRQIINLSLLAFTHQDLGHLDLAEQMHRQSLQHMQKINLQTELSWGFANIARILIWRGKLEEASQYAQKSVVLAQVSSVTDQILSNLTFCGIQIYAGKIEKARNLLNATLPDVKKTGSNSNISWAEHIQGLLALDQSAYTEAQKAFETSIAIWQSTYPHHFMPAPYALSLVFFRLGQMQKARQYLVQALSDSLTYQSVPPTLASFPTAALLLAAEGDVLGAIEIWELAKQYPFISNSAWFLALLEEDEKHWATAFPPETFAAAKERGRGLDLWETAESLLQELADIE